MAIILFTVFAGSACSAVSPLPEDYCDNFGEDPFTDGGLHATFMRQVLYRNGASCGAVLDRTAQRAAGVINLKLPHKQMHYQQSPFLNNFKVKTTTKVIKNTLAGHH